MKKNSKTTPASKITSIATARNVPPPAALNAQILRIAGDNVDLLHYADDLRPGDVLVATEPRGAGLVLQVVSSSSAPYAGASEAAMQEVLETAAAERYELINREQGLPDLKHMKLASAKIRRRIAGDAWLPWDGWITPRNVILRRVPVTELAARLGSKSALSMLIGAVERRGTSESAPFVFDARLLDKINVIVGNKEYGKSHAGKVMATNLVRLGAPCLVFDVNTEYTRLPGAIVANIGAGYELALHEVGFSTVMSVVDSIFPMTETARANLDFFGPRFVAEQVKARGFATLDYLIEKANTGDFGGGDMVARAIAERLIKVKHMRIIANKPTKTSLMTTLVDIGEHGGLLVFDLSALPPRAQRGVASGLNRIIERFCEDEKTSGTKRYPFVFFEEAHLYIDDDDVLNLVTRMRHLGLTSFFLTNRPDLLPNAVMSLVDNLFMLNLSSSTDVRAVAKSVLTDLTTLEGFAITLPPHYALVVGKVTQRFPLVVHVAALPEGTPASGVTQSFWDRVA